MLLVIVAGGCKQNINPGQETKSLHKPISLLLEANIKGDIMGRRLSRPFGIDADNSGNIFVIDAGNNRLLEFDSSLQPVREVGGFGTLEGLFNAPTFVTIDNNLNIYVSDGDNQRISIFDARLNYVYKIDLIDADDPLKFGRPAGLAINDYGELWVSDPDNSRISVFNVSNAFDHFVGDKETYSGLLLMPRDIAKGARSRMVVSDEGKARVFGFDSFGIYLFDFGKDILSKPSGVDLDPDGNIWVTDIGLSAAFCFAPSGDLLFSTANQGSTIVPGFDHPRDIAVISGGRLAISDTGNDRILIYKIIYAE